MISIIQYLNEETEDEKLKKVERDNIKMSTLGGTGAALGWMLGHHDEILDMVKKEPGSAVLPAGILAAGAGIGALMGTGGNAVSRYLRKRKQAKEEDQKRIVREILKEKNKGK